ncbi:MAG: DNA polymerase III subunit gamma/tau [Ichthyobacteriaceae bacterium]|nr:DNA polymerase III subunit gamma/tau [Ichthyobacteriaceae bacterium]
MENFVVSARKYRPIEFEDVIGQKAITDTLEHAISTNHLAQALLFTGPRGVGKTTCARILAKKINESSLESSDEDTDRDFAFNIFELDAASNNSVDDIRNLTEQVRVPPQTGNYKVYIIDEVHMLSTQAFNAFLKTLEEPPAHAIFILATTEKHKIIPTILSRCQVYDFKRIGVDDVKNQLAKIAKNEGIDAEDDALHIIGQKADGAMRDGLSIFDRIATFSNNKITVKDVVDNLNILDYDYYFKSTNYILENNIPGLLNLLNEILNKGFDLHNFISGLSAHFRDLLVSKDETTIQLLEVAQGVKDKYLEQSKKLNQDVIFIALDITNECDMSFKTSKNQRLTVEIALMQLASITSENGVKKKINDVT